MKSQKLIHPIRSESDYKSALSELQKIFDAKKGTPEYDRAEILEILIEDYENKHYVIENADPIEVIKYMMEENELNQSDLGKIIGDKAKASLILNKKRKLSISMIRKLNNTFKIPLEILIKDYQLAGQ